MKKEKIIKKFSLYINGEAVNVPQNPTWNGDLIHYKKGIDIRIGETIPGKELTWIVFTDTNGQTSWMCDRCLLSRISRKDCEAFIGQKLTVDGIPAVLDLPTMGMSPRDDDCDWTRALAAVEEEESLLHWEKIFSLGKEVWKRLDMECVAIRGSSIERYWGCDYSGINNISYGWRPVLRVLNTKDSTRTSITEDKTIPDLSTNKIRQALSLYIDGEAVNVPQNPTWNGDLIQCKKGMDIRIGETVPGKELTWIPFRDKSGQEAWMCDRCLLNWISRDDCEELIGRTVDTDKVHAMLDLPTMGVDEDDDCDWTRTLNIVEDEAQLHWRKIYSIGKEIWGESGVKTVPLRGFSNARYWGGCYSDSKDLGCGWRPVLRILNTDEKKETDIRNSSLRVMLSLLCRQ